MIKSRVFDRYKFNMEPIKNDIVDSIISIYGERYRSQIEDRLNRLYINIYVTADDLKHDYYMKNSKCLADLSIAFLRQIGEEIPKDVEDSVCERGITYYLSDEHKAILENYFNSTTFTQNGPIFSFSDDILSSESSYIRNRAMEDRCNILKKVYGLDINKDNYEEIIKTEEGRRALEECKRIYQIATECAVKYDKFKAENSDYTSYFEQVDEYRRKLDLKYLKLYAASILPYCSEEEQSNISRALESNADGVYTFVRLADEKGELFKTNGEPILDSFQGEDKEEVCRIKKGLDKQKEVEFITNTGNYAVCKKNLLGLGLRIQEGFSVEFVKSGNICTTPNVILDENGEYSMFNVVHLPLGRMLPNYKDVETIHELLHAVEANMNVEEDGKIHFKLGFDSCTEEISDGIIVDDEFEQEETGIRPFELLSENLHQELAERVTSDLHSKGIFIFDDPKTAKEHGSTSYEQFNVITACFQRDFIDSIVDGMMQESLDPFFNVVGKENYNRLNDCINEYAEIPYYKMMEDVIEKRDTELTRKRNSLIQRGIDIDNDMLAYRNRDYEIQVQQIGKSTVHQSLSGKREAVQKMQSDATKDLEGVFSKDE